MPELDPDVASLPSSTRAFLGHIWAERAKSELGAGSGFAQVLEGLERLEAHPEVLSLATKAVEQEAAHAKSCRTLAELYLGAPVTMPAPKRVGMPPHRGASAPLRDTLHLIGLCCFNETIAADFVARCLDASEADAVRRACSAHLRDEIGHARVGWAHLGSDALDRQDRSRVAAWMPRLVRANGEAWLARVRRLPPDGVAGHGYPPVRELERGVRRALRELVVPGLAAARIDATAASRESAAL